MSTFPIMHSMPMNTVVQQATQQSAGLGLGVIFYPSGYLHEKLEYSACRLHHPLHHQPSLSAVGHQSVEVGSHSRMLQLGGPHQSLIQM